MMFLNGNRALLRAYMAMRVAGHESVSLGVGTFERASLRESQLFKSPDRVCGAHAPLTHVL